MIETSVGATLVGGGGVLEPFTGGGSTVVVIVGAVVSMHGIDVTSAGLTQTLTGQATPTYTERSFTYILDAVGVPNAAEWAWGTDTALSLVGTIGGAWWARGQAASGVTPPTPQVQRQALLMQQRLQELQGQRAAINQQLANLQSEQAAAQRYIERTTPDLDDLAHLENSSNEVLRHIYNQTAMRVAQAEARVERLTGEIDDLLVELHRILREIEHLTTCP